MKKRRHMPLWRESKLLLMIDSGIQLFWNMDVVLVLLLVVEKF